MNLLPSRRRTVPENHAPFARLPTERVLLSDATTHAAIYRQGRFESGLLPLVCLPGYTRNMADFSDLAEHLRRSGQAEKPLLLIDLPGRGRAADRRRRQDYGSLQDARDVADILAALGIGRAVMLGQGHGGQVIMALAARHPLLVAGTILVDSGPVADPRGIVRLRNNLAHVDGLRGAGTIKSGFRRILGSDYPGLPDDRLDELSLRSHWFDKRGRARPLFDMRLIDRLRLIGVDDVLTAQWPLFDALVHAPLMLLRTQRTDQLRKETFDEMMKRRPDATALVISGQGSPALFDQHEDVQAVSEFVRQITLRPAKKAA